MRFRLRTLLIVLVFAPPMLALIYASSQPLIDYLFPRPRKIDSLTWEEAIIQAKAVQTGHGGFTTSEPPLP
jgi:hypothetical protein